MASEGQSNVTSSLRWADELDDLDSDVEGGALPVSQKQSGFEPQQQSSTIQKEHTAEPARERFIMEKSERSIGNGSERSFGEMSTDNRASGDYDRQRSQRMIDTDRPDFSSRDRDGMNRRNPRNAKKSGNRKGKFDQPKYEEDSWRCMPASTEPSLGRRSSSFPSTGEDDRRTFGNNRRNKEDNNPAW
ncbi:hypothetical protein BgAZ_203090 [Babesia gibsoni]|uniref:Uncharacterized protein n=1 Tax=Babesia gibsoni TaxID=33632 RepID=A0AAD8PDH5_BABGI|nr:hypothetical protein BgAZ_203090 [Babesia gibsoni]